MKIAWNSVKSIMKSTINKPVSTDACYLMRAKVEEFIIENTLKAEKALSNQNKQRKIQGLREKVRIDEQILIEVFENDKPNK